MAPKRYQPVRRIKGIDPDGNPIPAFEVGRSLPVALWRAWHWRYGVVFSLVLTLAAALSGRSTREVGLVLVTALVGQFALGLQNDLVDRDRDRANGRTGKPVAEGYLDPSTAMFAIAVAVLLVIPLSVANGRIAGVCHLAFLAVAMLGNAGLLRTGRLSFLPWAISFALLPAFLAYGGWGGEGTDTPPTIAITLCAALLGVGVHTLLALPGLVDENRAEWRTLPLLVALRIGAPKTLLVTVVYLAVVTVLTAATGATVGLTQ